MYNNTNNFNIQYILYDKIKNPIKDHYVNNNCSKRSLRIMKKVYNDNGLAALENIIKENIIKEDIRSEFSE